MNQFNDIPKLDEREVQAEFDDDRKALLIYTTKMSITVDGARQLLDFLTRALAEGERYSVCAACDAKGFITCTHGATL